MITRITDWYDFPRALSSSSTAANGTVTPRCHPMSYLSLKKKCRTWDICSTGKRKETIFFASRPAGNQRFGCSLSLVRIRPDALLNKRASSFLACASVCIFVESMGSTQCLDASCIVTLFASCEPACVGGLWALLLHVMVSLLCRSF